MTNPVSTRELKAQELTKNHLVASGLCFGLDTSDKLFLNFDPSKPHCWCNICGWIYQHSDINERKRRSQMHADLAHAPSEHLSLALSGRKMTPEAQYKLAAFGIISVTDLINHTDNAQAGREAPRCITK